MMMPLDVKVWIQFTVWAGWRGNLTTKRKAFIANNATKCQEVWVFWTDPGKGRTDIHSTPSGKRYEMISKHKSREELSAGC